MPFKPTLSLFEAFHPKQLASLLALLVLSAGCGGSTKPPTAPTTGIVTIDGKPLTQGRVTTEPVAKAPGEKPGKAGFGIIQSDGTFVLSTYEEQDGAVVGPHRVTLYGKPPYQPESDDDGLDAPKRKVKRPFDILRVIGQNFEVAPDQDNHFEIKLTSHMVRKYGERDD